MTDNAIVTENLTKVYGKLTAVDHVTVNVASGTVFGLLGPNGAGKTTMIKLLTGLTDMTEGDATVAGFNVRRDPMHVKQRIGWVASEVILDDDFSAWENLWLQSKLQSLPNWKDRAGDLLEYFGLKDRRKDRVKTFSTGMRKKLEIALALLHQPEVVFMDEPTIGLDAQDGGDPTHQRGEAEPRDGLPRHHREKDRPGGRRRTGLPEVLRDHAEGETMSTETTHARVTGRTVLSERRSVSQRSQFAGLYARELLRTFRNPWVLVITFVQPFMWLAFFGSSFSGASPALVQTIFHTNSYIAFLLPGVLATSMLTVGMFGSMSTIQDKRFGFMKRILLTPTTKSTVYLSKVLGSTSRGLIQIPVMILAAALFGVSFQGDPIMWAGWILGIFFLGLGMSSFFLAVTASSTDWQTPGVISNFITMPLMFASGALLPLANFPAWMQAIASVNPVSFSALLGRGIVVFGTVDWSYLGYLTLFAVGMLVVGTAVASRYLKAE